MTAHDLGRGYPGRIRREYGRWLSRGARFARLQTAGQQLPKNSFRSVGFFEPEKEADMISLYSRRSGRGVRIKRPMPYWSASCSMIAAIG